ncbi:Hypothetical predicted protein, partial [Paramuricea clavata]
MEYSGSFDKDEVIHNLTTNEGFRMQGCTVDANRTILDNSDQVGNYMETVQGVTTRCKIYNKRWRARAYEKPLGSIERTG